MKRPRSESMKKTIREAWAGWRTMGGHRQMGVHIEHFPLYQRELIRECRRAWLRWRSIRNGRRVSEPLLPK